MSLKRTKKRKSTEPRTTVPDFGMGKTLDKIDKAIGLLDKKQNNTLLTRIWYE